MDILKERGRHTDAAVAVVTVVEDDPNDDSVGYGGLPNEEGDVELDASVMHGPTHRAGSVASVRRYQETFRAWRKTVMEKTNHVMVVGDGARRFASRKASRDESPHRALAQDLARVEGQVFHSIGAGHRLAGMERTTFRHLWPR